MNADRFKTLYEASFNLMHSIYNGNQLIALKNAAKIRKELLDIRMQQIKEDLKSDSNEEISQILDEQNKIAKILNDN